MGALVVRESNQGQDEIISLKNLKTLKFTEKYEKTAILGEGSSSRVYEMKRKKDGARLAGKFILIPFKEDEKKCIEREINDLKILKSDHIVQIKDYFITNEGIYNKNEPELVLICELAECNLYDYINKR